MSVVTPSGLTERATIKNIVMQGEVLGPIECSVTVDKFGKECLAEQKLLYYYKGLVGVPPLAMVDDLIGISKCGLDSIELNTFINTQIELKKLRFHVPDKDGKSKCHKMHIGNKQEWCSVLEVHGTVMTNVTEETYLGDIMSSDGKI